MLNFMKNGVTIGSPVKGVTVDLKDVSDQVFSDKLIGDGIAVQPDDDVSFICAPCDGKITQVFHTNHAFYVLNNTGLEIMVHIGLDTVELKGKGFKRLRQPGDDVIMGEPIMEVDFSYIKAQGKETVTPVLVTNLEMVSRIATLKGAINISDKIMSVKVK